MSSKSGDGGVAVQRKNSKTKAFEGAGHRLGSTNEPPPHTGGVAGRNTKHENDNLPAKRVDPSLSDSERAKQREARLAAAKKREKASGGTAKKKKKATGNNPQALRGPNTKPLLRWNA